MNDYWKFACCVCGLLCACSQPPPEEGEVRWGDAPNTFTVLAEVVDSDGVNEILRINADGRVFYHGREIGTDPEIFAALQKVMGTVPCKE